MRKFCRSKEPAGSCGPAGGASTMLVGLTVAAAAPAHFFAPQPALRYGIEGTAVFAAGLQKFPGIYIENV